MRGTIPPLLQYAFMAWCLARHRYNFTFYLFTAYNVSVLHPCTSGWAAGRRNISIVAVCSFGSNYQIASGAVIV